MKHDTLATLNQQKDFAEEAAKLAKDHSRADLDAQVGFKRHAERIGELMGEACNRLPGEIQAKHPEIPWHQIVGTRNWLAHGYDGIDYDILWDTISRNAQELLDQIEPLIDEVQFSHREPEREISDEL